jgi:flagellar biogenesis protein FliO
MSLIRTRRSRKKNWIDARKGMPMGRLLLLLVLVVALIWYLGRL